MTTQRMLNIRILDSAVRSIAVFTVLIASLASAQQAGVGSGSAEFSAAPGPLQSATRARPLLRSVSPNVNGYHRVSAPKLRAAKASPSSAGFSFSRSDIATGLSLWGEVVAGDFNGDGKPDLMVNTHTSSEAMGIHILLGNGDGTFAPPSQVFSGCCTGFAVADFNGDGKLDVIFATGDPQVWVLLGNGDGTFTGPVRSISAITDVAPVVGDFNGDGKLDIALIVQGGGIAVGLGKGDGTFGAFEIFADGFSNPAFGLVVADFNGDGKLDLAATNPGTPLNYIDASVNILLGNGDGTFEPPTAFAVGSYAAGLVAADFSGDKKVDLAVTNYLSASVSVLLGNGDGTLLPANEFPVDAYPASIAVADFGGNGKIDLAVGGGASELCILPGNGDGTFGVKQDFPAVSGLHSLSISDFNLDGRPDVVVVPYTRDSGTLSVFQNTTGAGAETSTALTSSLNLSTFGQTVTFTASVTSTAGTPTGTVIFYDGSTSIGSTALVSGSAAISLSSLGAGSHSITASYQGSTIFSGSTSAPVSQVVKIATTTTSLASSLNPAGTSQSITFTATVTSQFGGAATSSVVFSSGSQTLGTASLSGNHATLTTSFSATGTYSISAKYNGDSNNSGSTSSSLSQVIITATATALVSSLNPSIVGQAVTFTATVTSPAGAPPNGELITFKNGSAVLGTAPLSGGIAALTTSSLSAGIFTITAAYGGDTNFTASTSPGLRQVVNSTTKSATSTTLSSSLNPSIYGQSVTWKATVTTSGPVPPTGSVKFSWSTHTIGTATLNSSGVATLTKSNLNVYTYPLTAAYSGDANNLASTSVVLNQVVKQATSTATLNSSPNPSTQGQAVTFTAKITSPTVVPTGPVTFKVGNTVLGTAQLSAGKATFTTSTLPVGSTVVTATYPWNSNIASSSASVTQIVQP